MKHAYVCIHLSLPASLATYVSPCIYVYTYVYIYIYLHTHTHIYIYIYTPTGECTYVCICMRFDRFSFAFI